MASGSSAEKRDDPSLLVEDGQKVNVKEKKFLPPVDGGLVLLLLVYVATMLVIPVMARVAVNDDWAYARSVELFVQHGEFESVTTTYSRHFGEASLLIFSECTSVF